MDPISSVEARKKINKELNLSVSNFELVAVALTHPSLGRSVKNTELKDGIGYQR